MARTAYAACLSRLDLSQTEASVLHDVGLQTVKNWCSGRTPVPQGIWDDLREYEARIVDGSEAMREAWEAGGSPPIELDDSEAGGIALASVADFLLNTPLGAHVEIGRSRATETARQARRPN